MSMQQMGTAPARRTAVPAAPPTQAPAPAPRVARPKPAGSRLLGAKV